MSPDKRLIPYNHQYIEYFHHTYSSLEPLAVNHIFPPAPYPKAIYQLSITTF